MKTLLAIDPGASGGFAWIDDDGIVQACNMPTGMSEQIDKLRELACDGYDVVIENVGFHMPGNSATATAKFARHVGHLEAAAYTLAMPVTYVAPQTWQKALGTWPKDKKERKNAIKEAMARRYPHLSVNLKTADALGILTWAMQS
jgi:hypothetical protein